jgi:hypothetical protein
VNLGRIPIFVLVSQLETLKLDFCSPSTLNEELCKGVKGPWLRYFLSRRNCLCNDDSVMRTAMSNTWIPSHILPAAPDRREKPTTAKNEANALLDNFNMAF